MTKIKKALREELIENYVKGTFNKKHEIITCGASEMVRFINRVLDRKKRQWKKDLIKKAKS